MFSTTDLNSISNVTSITQLFSVIGLDRSFAALLTFSIGRDVLDIYQTFSFPMYHNWVDEARERKHIQGTFGFILGTGKGFQVFFVHWF